MTRFELRFTVNGIPAPKGSATKGFNGSIRIRTDKVIAWESCVSQAAVVAMQRAKLLKPIAKTALKAFIVFRMPRPEGHYETHPTGMPVLKPSTRLMHVLAAPDIDKLLRSTLDAMSKLVYDDDARVVDVRARKRYCDLGEFPGADVSLESL